MQPSITTTNGIITCDDTNYEFDDDCLITCKDGFKLNGPSKMTCMADKTWSVYSKEVSCIGTETYAYFFCHIEHFKRLSKGLFINILILCLICISTDSSVFAHLLT
jgi:hypothetical protein